jgi:hypothetical protein
MNTCNPFFKKIDRFLSDLKDKNILKPNETIYDFFSIRPEEQSYDECSILIQEKIRKYSNSTIPRYCNTAPLLRDIQKEFLDLIASQSKRIEYKTYLLDKAWSPIEEAFKDSTHTNQLDLKNKNYLIAKALKLNFLPKDITDKIDSWIIRDNVEEIDSQEIIDQLKVRLTNRDKNNDLLPNDLRLRAQDLQNDKVNSLRKKVLEKEIEAEEYKQQANEYKDSYERLKAESVNAKPLQQVSAQGYQSETNDSVVLDENIKFNLLFLIYLFSAIAGWFIKGPLLWTVLPYFSGMLFLGLLIIYQKDKFWVWVITILFFASFLVKIFLYSFPHISGIIWALYISVNLHLFMEKKGWLRYKTSYMFLACSIIFILPILVSGFAKNYPLETRSSQANTKKISPYSLSTSRPYLTDAYNHNIRIANGIVRNSKKLYFNIDYSGAIPNKTIFTFYWYRDGAVIKTNRFTVKSVKGHMMIPCKYNFNKLNSGVYQVGVTVNNSRVLQNDLSFKVIEADNSSKVVHTRMITTTTHKNSYKKVVPKRMITTTIQNNTSETDSETQVNIENLANRLEKLQRKSNVEEAPTRMRSFNDAP